MLIVHQLHTYILVWSPTATEFPLQLRPNSALKPLVSVHIFSQSLKHSKKVLSLNCFRYLSGKPVKKKRNIKKVHNLSYDRKKKTVEACCTSLDLSIVETTITSVDLQRNKSHAIALQPNILSFCLNDFMHREAELRGNISGKRG